MSSNFLPPVNMLAINEAQKANDYETLYDLLVQPLHEELYRTQSFELMQRLSAGQQLLLAYDYVRMQVSQGGFIQFIQNGYISLLPDLIEQLYGKQANDMAQVLDDVLKVYVLNRELLDKPTNVQEFAQLYNELREFEEIDARFERLNTPTIQLVLAYATAHLDEFAAVI